MMRVLVTCERSGVVREAFRKLGHNAWSCDIEGAIDNSPYHIKEDVLKHLRWGWDLMIAHPPCTYLTIAANRWMNPEYKDKFPDREKKREEAISFFMKFVTSDIKYKCIENPVGIMSTVYRKPDQYIQPYQFGDDASKKTCLWLTNLPKLQYTNIVKPRIVDGKKRWANQTDSGQNRLGPSDDRSYLRSKTYQGIADAMAEQWSEHIGF